MTPEHLQGDNIILNEAVKPVREFMDKQGWFPVYPSLRTRTMDLGDGIFGPAIAWGVFPAEKILKTHAVTSEVLAYRNKDGDIRVQIHRGIDLPKGSIVNWTEEDTLLSLRLIYKTPFDISQPIHARLVQTFSSKYPARDVIRAAYNCPEKKGEVHIQRFGRRIYEYGFSYSWNDGELDITKEGVAWLDRTPPIPVHNVFGRVTEKTVFEMMDVIDTKLLPKANDDVAFQKEVISMLKLK